jgi:toxin ParE1/3/4
MAVKWLKTALYNIEAIAEFIAADNPERARTFVRELKTKTDLLAEFSGVGRAGRVAGTRELVLHENYIATYRVKGKHVEILRVRHVAQKHPTKIH